MIKSGWSILRFVKLSTARGLTLWYYKFTADSLKGEHIDFVFQVTAFGDLPQIIQDLAKLTKEKKWWNVHLVETKVDKIKMLMIQTIKEPLETQEELNEKSRLERLKLPL